MKQKLQLVFYSLLSEISEWIDFSNKKRCLLVFIKGVYIVWSGFEDDTLGIA